MSSDAVLRPRNRLSAESFFGSWQGNRQRCLGHVLRPGGCSSGCRVFGQRSGRSKPLRPSELVDVVSGLPELRGDRPVGAVVRQRRAAPSEHCRFGSNEATTDEGPEQSSAEQN
jgi:hypothetical protein